MAKPTGKICSIPFTVDPHMFFVIYDEFVPARDDLQLRLADFASFQKQQAKYAVKNKLYMVFDGATAKRACLISHNDYNDTYFCWLVDFGTLNSFERLYEIDSIFKCEPYFSIQARLNNVVALDKCLENDGMVHSKGSATFTSGAVHFFNEQIRSAKKISFYEEKIFNSISCGQLYLYKNEQPAENITRILIERGIIMEDAQLFEKEINVLDPNEVFCRQVAGKQVDETTANVASKFMGRRERINEMIKKMEARRLAQTPKTATSDRDDDTSSVRSETLSDRSEASAITNTSIKSTTSATSSRYDNINLMPCDMASRRQEKAPKPKKDTKKLYQPFAKKYNQINSSNTSAVSPPGSNNRNNNSRSSSTSSSPVIHTQPTATEDDNLELPKFSVNKNPTYGIGCNCATCKRYNVCDIDDINDRNPFEEQPKSEPPMTFSPQRLLKRSENDGEEVKLIIKKRPTIVNGGAQIQPGILAHGCLFAEPIKKVHDVPFLKEIHEALQRTNFNIAKPIQTYGWPAMMRNSNLMLVHSPKTGKTMTYLPALCSFLFEREQRYKKLMANKLIGGGFEGPFVCIICRGAQAADEIYALFAHFLNNVFSLRVRLNLVYAVTPINGKILAQFKRPCDVLITTPSTLIALLHRNVTNFKRLCHIVFEDLDVILENEVDHVRMLLKVIQQMLSHRTNCAHQVQFIATAEKWTPMVESMIRRLHVLPLVLMGNHLETSLYGRADISMMEVKQSLKSQRLYELLKDIYLMYKTIVFCNEDELDAIRSIFQLYGIKHFIAASTETDKLTGEDFREIQSMWFMSKSGNNSVLVCTDIIYKSQFDIINCSFLVNYSPAKSWGVFTHRLKSMIGIYNSPFAEKNTFNPKIVTFIDENTKQQIPRLMEFFQRTNITLPQRLLDYCTEFVEDEERAKIAIGMPLCKRLKLFGECRVSRCHQRHKLASQWDTLHANEFPHTAGDIRYQILYVKQVNRFFCKLTSFIDAKTKNVHRYDDHRKYIKEYFKNQHILERATSFNIGERYVGFTGAGDAGDADKQDYCRCVIVRKLEEGAMIEVKCLDTAKPFHLQPTNLFIMPDELAAIPPQCVEIQLTNIIPQFNDLDWVTTNRNMLINELKRIDYQSPSTYWTSRIQLTLQDCILVDNMCLNLVDADIRKISLKKFIVDTGLAISSDIPLTKLRGLCLDARIDFPMYEAAEPIQRKEDVQIAPQWSHLNEDGFDIVYLASAIDPCQFYVRNARYHDLLTNLEKSLTEAISNEMCYKSLDQASIEVGKLYATRDVDEPHKFVRVIVNEIDGDVIDAMLVDYGNLVYVKSSDLRYLREDFITKLPLQAIECELYGISPLTDNCWNDEATNMLFTYSTEPNSETFRNLLSMSLKTNTGCYKVNPKYSILLVDYLNAKTTVINQLLIDCGVAICDDQVDPIDMFTEHLPSGWTCSDDEEKDEDDDKKNNTKNIEDLLNDNDDDKYSVEDNDDDDGFYVELTDPVNFCREMTNGKFDLNVLIDKYKALEAPCNNSNNRNTNDGLYPITVEATNNNTESNKTFQPDVLWHQSNKQIHLNVQLCDVEDYEISFEFNRILTFKAKHNGKHYETKLDLYRFVSNDYTHRAVGPSIRIDINKMLEGLWPSLLRTGVIQRNVKFNYERGLSNVDDEDKKRTILTLDNVNDPIFEEFQDDVRVIDVPSDVDYDSSDIDEFEG